MNYYDEETISLINNQNKQRKQEQEANRNKERIHQERLRRESEEMARKSRTGSNGKRTGKKKTIEKNSFAKKFKRTTAIILTAAIFTSGAYVGTNLDNWKEEFHEDQVIGGLQHEIHQTYITPNTYRVNNNEDYAYHEYEIFEDQREDGLDEIIPESAMVYLTDLDYKDKDQETRAATDEETFQELMEKDGFNNEEELQEMIVEHEEEILNAIQNGDHVQQYK